MVGAIVGFDGGRHRRGSLEVHRSARSGLVAPRVRQPERHRLHQRVARFGCTSLAPSAPTHRDPRRATVGARWWAPSSGLAGSAPLRALRPGRSAGQAAGATPASSKSRALRVHFTRPVGAHSPGPAQGHRRGSMVGAIVGARWKCTAPRAPAWSLRGSGSRSDTGFIKESRASGALHSPRRRPLTEPARRPVGVLVDVDVDVDVRHVSGHCGRGRGRARPSRFRATVDVAVHVRHDSGHCGRGRARPSRFRAPPGGAPSAPRRDQPAS